MPGQNAAKPPVGERWVEGEGSPIPTLDTFPGWGKGALRAAARQARAAAPAPQDEMSEERLVPLSL
jgi:hypothetical protein